MIVLFQYYFVDTLTISTFISPTGNGITTSSPVFLPIYAAAIGDSFEIFPLNGSASAEPTIL